MIYYGYYMFWPFKVHSYTIDLATWALKNFSVLQRPFYAALGIL